jgi:hypothetical protein
MIAKTGTGKSFKGLTAYLTEDLKHGEILESDGVRNFSPQAMAFDFHQQAKMNSRTVQSVGHDSLSFSLKDRNISNNEMREIALDYMDKMGYKDTQFVVIRHNDRDHQHCHIIYNRVNNEGKTISDKMNYYKANNVCREMEEKYSLEKVNGQSLDKETKKERKRSSLKLKIDRYSKERNDEVVDLTIPTTDIKLKSVDLDKKEKNQIITLKR